MGGNRYKIYFEPLVNEPQKLKGMREVEFAALVRQYVRRLEEYCRMAPYNWFNFYKFWKE